jgi:hypothetical protein
MKKYQIVFCRTDLYVELGTTFRLYVELLCFGGFMNPTLRRPEPYIFAQAEGRRGFIKPEKLARLLPYMESV